MLADTKIRASKPIEKPCKLGNAYRLYLWIMPAGG